MQPKFRQNRCLFVALAGATLAGLWGCTRPPPPESVGEALPLEGQVIKVACPGEPVTTLLNRYTRAWARKTGARVEPVVYSSGADLPAVGEASAWIIRPAELPQWAAAGKLAAVPAEYR